MEANQNNGGRVEGVFRALRHRNYRLFFGGQLISLIGTFLTNTSMIWLAYLLAPDPQRKAWLIGVVAFASQIPVFILGPICGVWVDRLNRQKLLVVTQSVSMLQSFALAFLSFTHLINIPSAIGLALLQGTINSLDIPGRQAFLVEMVTDRQDLANAIALNSTMVHGARLIGPAIAGLLIGWLGIGWCFLLDAISYIAVIAALIAMRINPRPPRRTTSVAEELREGWAYVSGFKPARILLVLMAIFSLSGIPAMMVLMPIFGSYFGQAARGAQIFRIPERRVRGGGAGGGNYAGFAEDGRRFGENDRGFVPGLRAGNCGFRAVAKYLDLACDRPLRGVGDDHQFRLDEHDSSDACRRR